MSPNGKAPAYPALVIDGSSSSFFAGVLDSDGHWMASLNSPEPALESLFNTVDDVLKSAGVQLGEIRSYVYCEGPGSILGLRLCAMAIETWRRIHPATTELYSYNSLRLVASELCNQDNRPEPALLISDWKKDTWNSLEIRGDVLGEVKALRADELPNWHGPLYHLPARKGWQKAPDGADEITYKPEQLSKLLHTAELLKPCESVELYNSGINTFKKWTPERHTAGDKVS